MNSVNKYLAINCLIVCVAILIIIVASMIIIVHSRSINLQEKTGIVSEFKNREKTWMDDIPPYSADNPPYFRLKLNDGSLFEAHGLAYNSIDDELYGNLSVGDEITIIYNDKPWGEGVDTLYDIKYKGKTYLSIDDTLVDTSQDAKTATIVCSVVICVTVIGAVCLFVLNYKKNKHKYDNIFLRQQF